MEELNNQFLIMPIYEEDEDSDLITLGPPEEPQRFNGYRTALNERIDSIYPNMAAFIRATSR